MPDAGIEPLAHVRPRVEHEVGHAQAVAAPKLVGGHDAPAPIGGPGIDLMSRAVELDDPQVEPSGSDLHIHGRVARTHKKAQKKGSERFT